MEIRAVINQCGVAMELHGHKPQPITLSLLSISDLERFRNSFHNTDMCHATIGQLAVMWADKAFSRVAKGVTVSPFAWTYNASTDEYSH